MMELGLIFIYATVNAQENNIFYLSLQYFRLINFNH